MPEVAEPEPEVPGGNDSSLLEINIVEQIEYYFGDFNMMKDKFLKQEITKDDGWVAISTLLRFNRLAALSKNVDVIMSAFKKNPSSIVEVDEERKCVRRNADRPIPEHNDSWRTMVAERTIYVKGFPVETTTLDDILKFMQTFGKIDNVFKRSYFDKALKQWKFKGSVFVSFPTKEDAEKFMSIGLMKFAGNELIRKWQNDYVEEKKSERLKLKLEAKEMKSRMLKEQHDELRKDMKKLPTGALIALSGLNSEMSFNDVRDAARKLGWEVAFVDYNVGESNAQIRLQTADSAKDALAKLTDGSFEINGVKVKAELIEGEQETALLEKMEADKSSRVMQIMIKNRGKKGKGRKNKFGKQGKNGDADGDKKRQDEKMEDVAEPTASGQASESTLKRKNDDETREEHTKKSKPDEE